MMSKYFWKMDKLQKKGTLIKGEMLEKQETTNYTKECFSPQEKAGVVSIRENTSTQKDGKSKNKTNKTEEQGNQTIGGKRKEIWSQPLPGLFLEKCEYCD